MPGLETPHAIDAEGIHVLENALKIAREKKFNFVLRLSNEIFDFLFSP